MDTPETVMTNRAVRAPALLKTNIPWKNLGLNMLNHFISPPFLYQMNLFELNLFGSLTKTNFKNTNLLLLNLGDHLKFMSSDF